MCGGGYQRYAPDMQFTARIWPEEGGFVAECVELKVVSQGDTEDEALSNLREAVMGFLECADPSEVRERMHAGMQIRTFDVAV
jgi:predicted RNase H-like HicB family nuclease